MYLTQVFDHEAGEVVAVLPAASFEDALGALMERIGRSPEYTTSFDLASRYAMSATVRRGDIVIGSVEDVPIASPADDAVFDAVSRSDVTALAALFAPIHQKAPALA